MTPLGYDAKDRKITVNATEAERVRTIFRGYLKLGSLNLLMADLRKRGIFTKVRKLKTGERVGGIAFTRGLLAQLLRNRFYIGEVSFRGEVFKGEQPAILDRALFDAVQARLNQQINNHKAKWMKSEALLTGRIYDDRGNRMTPSHTCKGNVRYRYYLSSTILQGTAERAGSVHRVPATAVEGLVIKSVRENLKPPLSIDDRALITTRVARDARLSILPTRHSNRVSTNASLRGRETRFCGAETKAPKPSLQFNLQIAETKCVHKSPPVRGDSH
jgi:site-specific DNA recombinase